MNLSTGGKILALRRTKGIRQDELAARSGISQTYLSSVENDQRPNVSARVLARIATALGATVDDLLPSEQR